MRYSKPAVFLKPRVGESISPRAGFSLIEILLVVSLMAVIAGLTWPSLMRFIRDNDLSSQAENVRSELDSCRLRAIETGLAYQFRSEPQGRHYISIPIDRPDSGNDGSTAAADDFVIGQTANAVPVAHAMMGAKVTFGLPISSVPASANVTPPPPVEKLRPEFLALVPKNQGLEDVAWSVPIIFFPDGSCSGGTVILRDANSRSVTLTVRSLTAAVSVGKMESVEPLR